MYSPPILDFNETSNKGTLFDTRDGQSYQVVKIGKQIWLAENFRYEPSKDKGDPYEEFWTPDNSYLNKGYGRLYNWNTAMNIAPEGWRLPSNEDFQELKDFIIKDNNLVVLTKGHSKEEVGSYLKSTTSWPTNIINNDKYGFNAKPAGYYNSVEIHRVGFGVSFWCSKRVIDSKQESGYSCYLWNLHFDYTEFSILKFGEMELGYSVRLIKETK
jgi:uncharacterized protein (TIGR02145 family)